MRKKIITAAVAAVLCLSSIAGFNTVSLAAEKPFDTPSLASYEMKFAENDRFELMGNADGSIAVLDKESGYLCESNPQTEDPIAQGINMTNLKSQMYVTWADKSGNITTKNSTTDCVNQGWLTCAATADGGVRYIYEFQKVGITIPVEYHLNEKGLVASIVISEIQEDAENTGFYLSNIDFLPFLGAADMEDEGYTFVPDGCGALIYHNNDKSSYGAYSQRIFGRDAALITEEKTADAETARLPVFGMKNGDNGYLAVITKGDANAAVNAQTSGTVNSYNNVYASFQYRAFTKTTFLQGNAYAGNGKGGESSISLTVAPVMSSLPEYSVEYILLAEEDLDYVDMAQAYQDYLLETGGLVAKKGIENALYLNILGGLTTEEYVMGIETDCLKPLTTFAQAQDIVSQLQESGVNKLALKYTGWQKGGIEAKIPTKIAFEKKLGGKSDYKKLVEYAETNDIDLFMDFDFVNFYKSGNGYSGFTDAAQTVGATPAYQYTYNSNLLTKNVEERWKLLTPTCTVDAAETALKKKEKLQGAQISLSTLGNLVYSDYTGKENGIDRTDVKALWEDIFEAYKQEFDAIMVDEGNVYTFPYVTHVYDAPLHSSKFDLEDEEIPFYQLVLHGYLSYSTEPVNLNAVPEEMLLKAVETGSCLSACLMYADNAELMDTKYNYIFSGNYAVWKNTLSSYYKKTQEVLEKVAASKIVGHEQLVEDVYCTTYENGTKVYVNYKEKNVTIDDLVIPSRDFIYTQEGSGE